MKAETLKKLKDESKLTTKQISEKSGIPESTISRILSGQTDNPSFDSIYAIVKAMGGSLDSVSLKMILRPITTIRLRLLNFMKRLYPKRIGT